MKNEIYIVSSGPGFTYLFVLKSVYNIYKSKFLFFDSLINIDLLNFSNNCSLKLLIGKRFNQYSILKKTIYLLIFISYKKYNFVSKLKSGDINFFSRINNEIYFYKKKNINYKINPGITVFLSVFCNLNWFLTIRFKISTVLFVTYFNNNNLLKLSKYFVNKIVIYYMVNNNLNYILSLLNKVLFKKYYLSFIESFSYLYERVYIFNIYDSIFYLNKNFLKFNFPKILLIGKLNNYFNIDFLRINFI